MELNYLVIVGWLDDLADFLVSSLLERLTALYRAVEGEDLLHLVGVDDLLHLAGAEEELLVLLRIVGHNQKLILKLNMKKMS